MSVALRAKLLYFLATTLILLFGLQLAAAVVSEFVPSYLVGLFLYPVFLGRDPISIPNVLLNFSMLLVALGAAFYSYFGFYGKASKDLTKRQKKESRGCLF